MKQTPLEPLHLNAEAKMINFAGWWMPLQYTSIREEHQSVRNEVGIFDISHMGEIVVCGEGAASWLETMLTNRVRKLALGMSQYTLMLNEAGGVIDDLILYRTGEKEFFLVVNASKREEDLLWLKKHLPKNESVFLEDQSDSFAALALQGPSSQGFIEQLFPSRELPKRHQITRVTNPQLTGTLLIARTGYTGEDGFEIFGNDHDGLELWQRFTSAGAKPCGLGARDTLRLEMGYPLNGSDLLSTRTPLQAGLGKFVSLDDPLKGTFLGRTALEKQRALGITSLLTPLQLSHEGPPLRSHYSIYDGEKFLGETTSGAFSPSLEKGIALAYLPQEYTKIGTILDIEIRGKRYKTTVTTTPFYKK